MGRSLIRRGSKIRNTVGRIKRNPHLRRAEMIIVILRKIGLRAERAEIVSIGAE